MATFRGDVHKLFPLKSTADVIKLFRQHLEHTDEPDLTLLSIVTGIIENTLTSKCAVPVCEPSSTTQQSQPAAVVAIVAAAASSTPPPVVTAAAEAAHVDGLSNFPVVQFEVVRDLYEKFKKILSIVDGGGGGGVGKHHKSQSNTYATRELIKKVSDVVWNSLIRSTYKDRAHLQSLYSYLAGSKLDCFGVALAVVAGCQMLGYADVHLAISEDHAWVVFGKTGTDTIEVTWHGKGTEDKRGQPVTTGYESHSWLYLAGNPVVCTRSMEVSAIISSINPSLNMTSACLEVADLQQQLLWLMYDLEHLQKYPMGLGCLGELEEVSPTPARPNCELLYMESVKASRSYYRNHHVYPYTYQGGYYYRHNMYKEAFSSWANAGDVIRLYNYSRDDEEIYKEFLDIANELIPLVMKTESSGHSARSVLRDPQCFANLLRFYDGICQWEEGSQTPILHIGWAKPLVTTISRFDCDIRSQVIINVARDDEDVHKFAAAAVEAEAESNNNVTTVSTGDGAAVKSLDDKAVISSLDALTAACGEKILNPDFLLQGGGEPFAAADQHKCAAIVNDHHMSDEKKLSALVLEASTINGDAAIGGEVKAEVPVTVETIKVKPSPIDGPTYEPRDDIVEPVRPTITLYSRKMKGIRDLLLAEKLNTHAISLQVTAQSQVQVGGKKGRSLAHSVNYAAKRSRRQ